MFFNGSQDIMKVCTKFAKSELTRAKEVAAAKKAERFSRVAIAFFPGAD